VRRSAYSSRNAPSLNTVLLQASKILFTKPTHAGGDLTATSVSFISSGVTHRAHASKEVILGAGAVQTPQLLELSGTCPKNGCLSFASFPELGIGDKRILSGLGIETLVDLPGVGTNLQVFDIFLTPGVVYNITFPCRTTFIR
jgi:choline dehydrogenase-like flavoprotein